MVRFLFLLLFLTVSAWAKEQIPPFQEVAPGLEYRQVLLDKPRPLTMMEFRVDPASLKLKLLMASDGGHDELATAREMLDRHKLLLAVNSSYFGHKNEILGYARRGEEVLNSNLDREGFLTAYFYWDGKKAYLRHRDDPLPANPKLLFQCGPRLVWDSEPVAGLEKERQANRTAIALDSEGRVCLVVIGGLARTTLAELPGLLLRSVDHGGVGAVRAMNLDGGKSTQACFKGKQVQYLPGYVKVPVFLGVAKP